MSEAGQGGWQLYSISGLAKGGISRVTQHRKVVIYSYFVSRKEVFERKNFRLGHCFGISWCECCRVEKKQKILLQDRFISRRDEAVSSCRIEAFTFVEMKKSHCWVGNAKSTLVLGKTQRESFGLFHIICTKKNTCYFDIIMGPSGRLHPPPNRLPSLVRDQNAKAGK